jgi:hypothetical protein
LASLAKDPAGPLPDPRLIWWRAHWLQSRAAGERAARPILLYKRFAAAALAIGAGVLAWTQGAWLWQWIPLGMSFHVWGAVALVGLGSLLAIRSVLAED